MSLERETAASPRPAFTSEGAREALVGLVAAARRGDREAFAGLYETYAPVVHGVLVSRVARSETDDLVHDVFLKALRSIGSLDDPQRFGAWICTIARNRARDAHKARRDTSELPEDVVAATDRSNSADDEHARLALARLRELPEAYRETLALRLVEGLSGPEIAARTGLTPGSVRVNLCRGMKLLRERLGAD